MIALGHEGTNRRETNKPTTPACDETTQMEWTFHDGELRLFVRLSDGRLDDEPIGGVRKVDSTVSRYCYELWFRLSADSGHRLINWRDKLPKAVRDTERFAAQAVKRTPAGSQGYNAP